MTMSLRRREKDIGELTVRVRAKVDSELHINEMTQNFNCVVSRAVPWPALPGGRNYHHHHLLCDEGQR